MRITVGKYTCDPGQDIMNLLISKRVDLVLTGHDHSYQRTHQLALGAGCSAVVPNAFNASCVVDTSSSFTKGAGTVMATVATGGNSLYDITANDTEAGYFAVSSGANKNPTWGVLDVSATQDTLQANFDRASGGNLSDAFSITKGQNPPPNNPPVAALTPHCTNLVCTFDSVGSSDPDPGDSIASYAWTFGDGATGNGASPGHTYQAAGTYPIRLTVTDTHGATGTANRFRDGDSGNRDPPTPTTHLPDRSEWLGNRTDRWGMDHLGWDLRGGRQLRAISTNAGATASAYLNTVSAPETDLRAAFQLDKHPSGSGMYVSVFGRRTCWGYLLHEGTHPVQRRRHR